MPYRYGFTRFAQGAGGDKGGYPPQGNAIAPGGITFLDEVATAGTVHTGVTSAALDSTGASVIVMAVTHYTFSGTPSVSDSEGNTWQFIASYNPAGNSAIRLYYCNNPSTSATHTFTASDASLYGSIAAMAFSGTAIAAPESENGNSANTNSLLTGSVTPSTDGALLVTALCSGNTAHESASVDAGFSTPVQGVASGTIYNVGMAYQIQPSAGAVNPTWSVTTSTGMSAINAVWLAA